ncbi:Uncharacterised protein [Vibrio cholerae]|nr:Uncharacterised protein [Vibrio cholerae]
MALASAHALHDQLFRAIQEQECHVLVAFADLVAVLLFECRADNHPMFVFAFEAVSGIADAL